MKDRRILYRDTANLRLVGRIRASPTARQWAALNRSATWTYAAGHPLPAAMQSLLARRLPLARIEGGERRSTGVARGGTLFLVGHRLWAIATEQPMRTG